MTKLPAASYLPTCLRCPFDRLCVSLCLCLQETVLEVLRQGWKDTEEADKGKPAGESAFEQKRFAADWWDGAWGHYQHVLCALRTSCIACVLPAACKT